MLQITIPAREGREIYNEETNEFFNEEGLDKDQVLQLEHSLISLSKWESKWKKPFLGKDEKTLEETIDYVKCMTLTSNINENAYKFLTKENINDINNYIKDPMTATTIHDISNSGRRNTEIYTAELIYYYMIAFTIPVEFQKWHLNRLMTLIRICSIKNEPPKKMSKGDVMRRNAALNASRRQQMNSKG